MAKSVNKTPAKTATKSAAKTATARLRVVLAPDVFLGPGKADLLEGIAETGSISAAGRRLNMSYKRAWMLVETLNGYFAKPLVTAATGGKAGGGATLTALGQEVLMRYRRMAAATEKAIAADVAALQKKRQK